MARKALHHGHGHGRVEQRQAALAERHALAERGQREPGHAGQPRQVQAPARKRAGLRGLGLAIGKISKFLQIFVGLVLGCIKTKFCKKICV